MTLTSAFNEEDKTGKISTWCEVEMHHRCNGILAYKRGVKEPCECECHEPDGPRPIDEVYRENAMAVELQNRQDDANQNDRLW